MKESYKFIITIVCAAAVILLVYFGTNYIHINLSSNTTNTSNSSLDETAKCLTENGAVMYGAYWCPHCQAQKADFGSSFQYINYTECDPNGENANPAACQEAGISGYPTWIINGQQYPGEQTIDKLKELTGCQ